ncbi:MAG: glycine cleavage system protein H [Candidatus Scalinduaceae bacterium]
MTTGKLKYSQTHYWIKSRKDIVTIGVTDYFINEIGNIIDLVLPKVKEEIITGISYGEIESINNYSDLIAPISGEVIKVNSDLPTNLSKLKKDPFGDGWFIKVRIIEPKQLETFMNEDEYEEYKKSIKKKTRQKK